MSYFTRFPLVTYTIGDVDIIGVDITRRTGIFNSYKTNSRYYIEYNIQEGETPGIIADRFYDSVDYAWIILMFNDIFNIYEQWPMDSVTFSNYMAETYENPNAVHHYESIASGLYVDSNHITYDKMIVTNYEYEYYRNEAKRKIKLLIPDYIADVVNQHNKIIEIKGL